MTNKKEYIKHMKKCLKLAQKGEGKTSPNPLVGCVVLDKNGKEIATGYHKAYGEIHAEPTALNKLKNNEAKDGTLIVNLEPCSHWGKNPPCADLIIEKGIKRLVVAMTDPNPLVAGEGLEKCRNAGIEIIENVLKYDAETLNEVFIKNMTKKSTFIAIKTATTIDGKIATKTGQSKWITSEKARNEVQKIRNRYDAILTTSSTIIKDDPSMTCRMKNGRNPIKIVLDRELKTDLNSKIYSTKDEKIYIVIDEKLKSPKVSEIPTHVEVIKCPTNNFKFKLDILFEKLFEIGIKSVLIEAGGKLNGEIVSANLSDKIYHFIAPKILADKNGLNAFAGRDVELIADTINYKIENIKRFTPDILITYKKG